jgi:hypothetical protein
MTTKTEREWMSKVAQMPCVVCGSWPVQVHHAGTGAGGRRDHMKVLPVCFDHHQGKNGIHTLGRKKWQGIYGTETELLEKLIDPTFIPF